MRKHRRFRLEEYLDRRVEDFLDLQGPSRWMVRTLRGTISGVTPLIRREPRRSCLGPAGRISGVTEWATSLVS